MKKFSPNEAIKFGWQNAKKHLKLFVIAIIIQLVVELLPDYLDQVFLNKEENEFLSLILLSLNLLLFLTGILINMGMMKISLMVHDEIKTDIAYLFSCTPQLFKYLIASLLYILIITCGLLLFIIPGIIWMIKFGFYGYFIVDKNSGIIESLKQSASITKNSIWDLFTLGLMLVGTIFLGILCLGIGIFWAYPTALIAVAFVYRKLLAPIEISRENLPSEPAQVEFTSPTPPQIPINP